MKKTAFWFLKAFIAALIFLLYSAVFAGFTTTRQSIIFITFVGFTFALAYTNANPFIYYLRKSFVKRRIEK